MPLVTSQPVALPSLKPLAWPRPMPSPGRMQPAVLIGQRAGGCPHIRSGRGGAAKGGEVEEITKFVSNSGASVPTGPLFVCLFLRNGATEEEKV